MIKFRYTLKPNLVQLAQQTIKDYNGNLMVGYMDEGDTNNLKHTSLYLVCEILVDEIPNDKTYQNPIVVVAKNEYTAVNIFNKVTGLEGGSVLCEIENRCDELKVEPF